MRNVLPITKSRTLATTRPSDRATIKPDKRPTIKSTAKPSVDQLEITASGSPSTTNPCVFQITFTNLYQTVGNGVGPTQVQVGSSQVGGVYIEASQLIVPSNACGNGIGLPSTLGQLIQTIGSPYISITYSVMATGNYSSFNCTGSAVHFLYASAMFADGSTQTGLDIITDHDTQPVNSGWVSFPNSTSVPITFIGTNHTCSGPCVCFSSGFSGLEISLQVTVSINMLNYCMSPGSQNISNNYCFNFMTDFLNPLQGPGPNSSISEYLANYCSTKYPNGTLDLFNSPDIIGNVDYQICACNMPQTNYNDFLESVQGQFPNVDIGQIPPQCLFPPCLGSSFKGVNLNGCPLPQCFELVDLNGNVISGNVQVNQSENCSNYGIPNFSYIIVQYYVLSHWWRSRCFYHNCYFSNHYFYDQVIKN